MDATTAAVLSELVGIFMLAEEHENVAEGVSWWTTLLGFTPDWLWNDVRHSPRCIVASHGVSTRG